jgi:3',5'-nucleoside bisphosphate phosphatase
MSYLFKNKIKRIRYADLHLHTDKSDGILSPEQIVTQANHNGLSTIAITDHDTLEGIKPALSAGKRHDVEIIPGLELSSESEGEEIHILGYFIDWQKEQLLKRLYEFREARQIRALQIIDRLKQLGMDIQQSDVFHHNDSNSVGRPHLAAALVKSGYVETISEAFQRFIGNNAPAYIPKKAFSPSEAINLILDAEGIPVLAHPTMIKREVRDVLEELVSYGLMGIEAIHSYHTTQLSDYYGNLARQHNLLITGGSDYHGFENSKRALGNVKIPYEYVEKLKTSALEQKIKIGNKQLENSKITVNM